MTLGMLLWSLAYELRLGYRPPCSLCRAGRLRRSTVLAGWPWCDMCGTAVEVES